jgi:NAD(P)-dependent dehydrogenase (short-subunit alcohol dehydrogenase family)
MVTTSLHDTECKKSRNHLQPLDVENFFLFNDGTYNGLQAYKNSKLANVMFALELATKLENTGVTVNCVNPGYIPATELMRSASGAQKFFARVVLHHMLRFTKATRTVQQGAQAIANLVTEEKYKGKEV